MLTEFRSSAFCCYKRLVVVVHVNEIVITSDYCTLENAEVLPFRETVTVFSFRFILDSRALRTGLTLSFLKRRHMTCQK